MTLKESAPASGNTRPSGLDPLSNKSWERPGTRALEYVFLASAPLPVFVVFQAVLRRFLHFPPRDAYLFVLSVLYVGTWWSVRSYRRVHPGFLAAPPGYKVSEIAGPFVGWLSTMYLVFAFLIGTATFLLIDRSDHHWPIVVLALSIWLPPFFAVPAAAVIAWRRAVTDKRPVCSP